MWCGARAALLWDLDPFAARKALTGGWTNDAERAVRFQDDGLGRVQQREPGRVHGRTHVVFSRDCLRCKLISRNQKAWGKKNG